MLDTLSLHAGAPVERLAVCRACWLCQGPGEGRAGGAGAEASESWLAHCRRLAIGLMAEMRLGPRSLVAGAGPGAGTLLDFFRGAGVPVRDLGGALPADWRPGHGRPPDLICALDGLARTRDPNGFVGGLAAMMEGDAVCMIEVPHLLALISGVQIDRIGPAFPLHLSLLALEPLFARAGLRLFDACEVAVQGGSLRIRACREGAAYPVRPGLAQVRAREAAAGLDSAAGYAGFAARAARARDGLIDFLTSAHHGRKTVAAFGAPCRVAALLANCGADPAMIAYSASEGGDGARLSGTAVPAFGSDELRRRRPDFVLILPESDPAEVMGRLADLRRAGTRLVTALPVVSVTA
ncbi:MAG: hypothetical protein JSR87_08670 [Proteobacteria bacterium]|nr:hypothetical protein [Pseudomonadota bacterium]